jgi:hypothetical protein
VVQSTKVSPSGLLAVVSGTVKNEECLALLKLERERGIHFAIKRVDGHNLLDLELLRDLTLTDKTKVYKTARARLDQFGDRPFRVGEAEHVGVPRYELYRLRDRGELVGVGRGVFRRAGGAISSSTDLATVCARVPGGIICSNSALAYWDLSDELPAVVHVAVARGAHRPHIEVHVFAAATFDLERREETTETGERVSIYSAERAVVDAMRLAHRLGRDTALHALNRYLRRADAQPRRLLAIARELGGSGD